MKKILLLLPLLIFGYCTSAQTLYGNEWIFDYSKTWYKVKVAKDGIYRITQAALTNAGLGLVPGQDYMLFNKGQEVPLYVSTNGILSSGDFLEFYGEKNDGWFDSLLYKNPSTEQLNPFYSMFNDTSVYFLVAQSGFPHQRYSIVANNSSSQPAEPWFMHHEIYTNGSGFSAGDYKTYGTEHVHPSAFNTAEGFFAAYTGSTGSFSISTPSIASSAPATAKIDVYTAGVYNQPNSISVSINNQYNFAQQVFSGVQLHKFSSTTVPLWAFASNTPINFSGSGEVISAVDLWYPRLFRFGSRNFFKFEINSTLTSYTNKHLLIDSFNHGGAPVVLLDLTNKVRISTTPTSSSAVLDFLLPNSPVTIRNLVLAGSTSVFSVSSVTPVKFIDYSQSIHQGNYIIISHNSLRNDNGHDYVRDYAAYRNSLDGGSYDTLIADIDLLTDQFAYGIMKHPLAVRNFAHYVDNHFTKAKPFYFFLIGKGITYDQVRTNSGSYNLCKIPTIGTPAGSDNLLTAYNNSDNLRIAIGRLSAYSPSEVNTYLQKIQEYEYRQKDFIQTIDNKFWMKQVMHLTGGTNAVEQSIFDGYLNTFPNSYREIIEDTSYGANVWRFAKTSSQPIQISASLKIDSLITSGTSLLTFFGHSAFNTLEFAIDNPETYKNNGKYPMIISNGCFTGNIFDNPANNNNIRGLSERFVIPIAPSAPNIGAIAYLSPTDFGISSGLRDFSGAFYENISRKHYGNSIGECIRIGADSLLSNGNQSFERIVSCGEMTLHGDPAIKLNPFALPDYTMTTRQGENNLRLSPPNITFEQGGFFNVIADVVNIGRSVDDSILVTVSRNFPKADLTLSGVKEVIQTFRIKAPGAFTTLNLQIPLQAERALGQNEICITVDAANQVNEISETNNEACISFNITSMDILPVWPYPFSIVGDNALFTLKGSTVEPFAPARKYLFEIDTTEHFNSTFLKKYNVTQSGGVVTWSNPPITWIDSTVYYWRLAVDTLYGNHTLKWHNSSFTYIRGSSPGWNQQHYYQFEKDDSDKIFIAPSDRTFKYFDDNHVIKVKDFNNGTSDQVAVNLDYVKLGNGGSCIPYVVPGGFNIVVLDSATGQAYQSGYPANPQGDFNCGGAATLPVFQYITNGNINCPGWGCGSSFPGPGASNNTIQQSYLTNFINNFVPNGAYVLFYSINDFAPQNFDPALRNAFHTLFGTTVLDTMSASRTYVLFARKGGFGFATKEVMAPALGAMIDTQFIFSAHWYKGIWETPTIGPAVQWSSLHWRYTSVEPTNTDSTGMDLIGVDAAGNETLLLSNNSSSLNTINISNFNATQYPYMKIRMATKDTTNRTPSQLKYWRINYSPAPELALDQHSYFSFHSDTLERGDLLDLKIAVRNVSDYNFDTVYTKYSVTQINNHVDTFLVKMKKLPKQDTLIAHFTLGSTLYPGLNSLNIDVNPFNVKHQTEQFHYNNLGYQKFFVNRDYLNPLLDVSFDGLHIIDGDIVSAKPHILIKLKDENKYLALDSIGLLKVSLKNPGSDNYIQQTIANSNIKFNPASDAKKNNMATIEFDPTLSVDGIYHLRVQGQDKSFNAAGKLDYDISFQVINKPMISNVVNYPNPFTTQTKFVFTVTGSEVPTYFKIQIMTVTGIVVRELTMAELGMGMHIGRNISEYAWDGTDQFGSRLANGVYLYRVVANLNGTKMDKYANAADKYFKSGFGKMYLMK